MRLTRTQTTVAAYVDDVQVIAPFLPCTPASSCTVQGINGAAFAKIGPIPVLVANANPVLRFVLDTPSVQQFTSTQKIEIDDVSLVSI